MEIGVKQRRRKKRPTNSNYLEYIKHARLKDGSKVACLQEMATVSTDSNRNYRYGPNSFGSFGEVCLTAIEMLFTIFGRGAARRWFGAQKYL